MFRVPASSAVAFAFCLLLSAPPEWASAIEFRDQVQPLIDDSCIDCHDANAENGFDFAALGNDLTDAATFRKWERVFDRVTRGEMPPESESRPDAKLSTRGLVALSSALTKTVRNQQRLNGRVILRRLNRTEYGYTMKDLLGLDTNLSPMIPAENVSTSFDTVYSNQGFSPLHIEAFLTAADAALMSAIELGRKPETKKQRFLYKEQEGVRKHFAEKSKQETVLETDDAVVMFNTAGYIFKVHGLDLEHDGRYRIRAKASAYQSEGPVILTINAGDYKKGSQRVLGFYDLEAGDAKTFELETTLTKGEYLFPGAEGLQLQEGGKNIWNIGAEDYTGAGIAIEWIEVEGPLVESWPPPRTAELLQDIEVRERDHVGWERGRHIQFELVAGENPEQQIEKVVKRLAPRAFRRPLRDGEADVYVALAKAALAEKRSIDDAVRVACRGVLNSPEFLFLSDGPGPLDDYALAERLSYFLWKSMPDATLFKLARKKQLHDPQVLRQQVDRMLDDPKSKRFVDDFVDQWLRLAEIDATKPDEKLYPEYDELLKLSMLSETRSFVAELIAEDLSTDNLIDSKFAMLNRRMAEHYGIDDVEGQQVRKVALPPESRRGGILTHASVLKVTANGTVTTPVRRGSWVLTHLLGTPPSPPPPGIGSIEPDTRGTTTIRETLAAHRDNDTCASCHRTIDPPGFALECFDVIGGYRERYRSVGEGDRVEKKLLGRDIWEYKSGLPVDCSGKTPGGDAFANIIEFRKLLKREREQVARNVLSQLLVYGTGAEIQFSDRAVVEELHNGCRKSEFGMRTMIHEIVQSRLFREK